MKSELPPALRALARTQSGVVSRSQALRAGISTDMIKFRLMSRWQPMHRGVYATFTGVPGRPAQLWAALLACGPGAAISFETAAELHGLLDKGKMTGPVHVTVPHDRRVVEVEGVCLHRSGRAVVAVDCYTNPPRTTVEETVLDLTHAARSFDDVCGWVTRAFARNLTDQTRLRKAMKARVKLRWRADLGALLLAAEGGDHSVLEFRYHRDVERAHRLPEPDRQVPFTGLGGSPGRRDRVYKEYGLVVELDGRLAHPAERQWRDKARDNAAAADGQQTLRYGWAHVRWEPCATAVEVAKVLRQRGWDGWPRSCSPGCPAPAELIGQQAPSSFQAPDAPPGASS